ncbi:MAG: hypothetical protein SV760_05785, partial [Halobacteria archaeon]|nr:hypothetical protein [Halobacteria archaeon]
MVKSRLFLVVALTAVFVVFGIGTALADKMVVGGPEIKVSLTDSHFSSNERVTLRVMLSNNGDIRFGGPAQYEARVKTARNLRLKMRDTGKIDVKTEEVLVGSLPEGTAGPFGFTAELGDLKPGKYRIPIEMEYEYTRTVEYGVGQPQYYDFSTEVTK